MRFLIFLLFCILQNFAIQSSDYDEENTNIFRLGRIYSSGINISPSYVSYILSGDFSFSSDGHLLWISESHYKYFRIASYSGMINSHISHNVTKKEKVKFYGKIYALKFLLPLPLSKIENYIGSLAISATIGSGLGMFYLHPSATNLSKTQKSMTLSITELGGSFDLLEKIQKTLEHSYLSAPGMASIGIEYRPIDFIGLQANYNFYVIKTIISDIASQNFFWLDNSWSIGAVISF